MPALALKPKKSLGQNFLIDKNITSKILQACGLKEDDLVLEIGPGLGQLTAAISGLVKKLVAVELDADLCSRLERNIKAENTQIICQDILRFDFAKVKGRAKVIGNIPYYISTPIISYLIERREKISAIYLSLQKELGLRLIALPGGKDYGAFSCFVQYHTLPRILFNISRSSFRPRPAVDSVFLEMKIREAPAVKVSDEGLFFKIIHLAFNQRRKMLINSLSTLLPKPRLLEVLEKIDIKYTSRPEQLGLKDFARISDALVSSGG